MHGTQKKWCDSIKERFPNFFKSTRVLEVGSLNVNGTNRYLFEDADYVGVDIVKGPGVDVVCKAHQYRIKTQFDVALSTNALEHDMFWHLTLPQMIRALRHGGLMFFSCGYSQKPHGIMARKRHDSGTTQLGGDWSEYYKNLGVMETYAALNPERSFGAFMLGKWGRDLRFWGIKR